MFGPLRAGGICWGAVRNEEDTACLREMAGESGAGGGDSRPAWPSRVGLLKWSGTVEWAIMAVFEDSSTYGTARATDSERGSGSVARRSHK